MRLPGIRRRSLLAGLAATPAFPALVRAQGNPKAVISHGIAIHGEPNVPADAKSLAYANPDAPKGGTIRVAGRGTFDSLNSFILKGTPARAAMLIYDTLLD